MQRFDETVWFDGYGRENGFCEGLMEWFGLLDELHGYTRWKNEGGNCKVYEMGMMMMLDGHKR